MARVLLLGVRTARAIAAIFAVLNGGVLIVLLLQPSVVDSGFLGPVSDYAVVFVVAVIVMVVLRPLANELYAADRPGRTLLTSHWRI